jgi:hypothetical protein
MRPTLGRLVAELSFALVAIFVVAFAASGLAVAAPCDVLDAIDVDVARAIAMALSSTA